ncbi:GTP-binding protein [Pseudobacteriovorax antillogorgiicola]|uniref:GTP-binding protein n=1 Tax=Pseudobacteriovorax antillogorgiicola TaxID=1513793 RepID=A0A1Y6BS20_9BACT|nr:GTP-binding protein [Pseudobacteriovorax antillogorgiicola]TCS53045.1 GTP-binding protein [Pseudobacteriovorax antillogorgiicola]SMF26451.1 GTP-binding protein [Pseudobacteriovorax antillogorgiicola]
MSQSIRNICTIAHVDHGKTTLVDFLLKQSGTFQAHETVEDRVMDSDSLERERGITISAKNASFKLGTTKVNIVDTPGHADFGGEVERIMDMVDGAILLVDAAEGPLPQTRFVLGKAIEKGLRIILCVNKVDRPECRESDLVENTVNKVFDLFVELGASDDQCEFPIVYACARDGWCTTEQDKIEEYIEGQHPKKLDPLFEEILKFPEAKPEDYGDFRMLLSNVAYDNFVGSLALGKVRSGDVKKNDTLFRIGVDAQGNPVTERFMATRIFVFDGMKQKEVESLSEGDIGLVAGCDKFEIGDTIVGKEGSEALERIEVEEPTMRMLFSINTGPNSGKEGKAIQSRELRERLLNECRANPALKMEDTDVADQYYLLGRGELQFGIIIERMRREGLEFMVGRPNVLMKQADDGSTLEPYESLVLDLPEAYSGDVTKIYQQRKGVLASYESLPGDSENPRVRLTFEIPTRGILGTNSQFLTATRGTGIMSSETIDHRPHTGVLAHRTTGSIISDRKGETTDYALNTIQQRGVLFIGTGVEVYEGMIIGECAKDNDLNVNACRPKKLTNVRSSGSDGIIQLNGTKDMSLEACIEWIDDDEWIEITPEAIRLRKKVLAANQRPVKKNK